MFHRTVRRTAAGDCPAALAPARRQWVLRCPDTLTEAEQLQLKAASR
ncbi:hypothetical protein [Streptomyces sp. NPDC014793]